MERNGVKSNFNKITTNKKFKTYLLKNIEKLRGFIFSEEQIIKIIVIYTKKDFSSIINL